MQYMLDRLNALSLHQLKQISLTLNMNTEAGLQHLEIDLTTLYGVLPHQEMHNILRTEIFNYFTGKSLESMQDDVTSNQLPEKIDYMAAIKEACGR